MIRHKPAAWLCLAAIVGFGLGVVVDRRAAPVPQTGLACRPSAPAAAAAQSGQPVVLIWGNSLGFDHGWQLSGFTFVNCARQGMTAQQAAERTALLPMLKPDAVMVVLGSVEMARGGALNLAQFREDVDAVTSQLMARYPMSRLITASVPFEPDAGWRYPNPAQIAEVNTALRQIGGPGFLDLSQILRQAGVGQPHYDGVHLTAESYRAWERALRGTLP